MKGDLDRSVTRMPVTRIEGGRAAATLDTLAVEEPLEIVLAFTAPAGRREEPVSITMRTPGHDRELAVGFLVGEGIVRRASDVVAVRPVAAGSVATGARSDEAGRNGVVVEIARDASGDLARLARHFYTTSSCGVCGKASIDALRLAAPPLLRDALPPLDPEVLYGLPAALRDRQAAFSETGGLHAAALFDAGGKLVVLREDVGRHNAVDKVVGNLLLGGKLPLPGGVLMLSGRASFELVQKALLAGIGAVCAVGAPSSLAVEMARESGMALVGFLRDERMNVYAGRERFVVRDAERPRRGTDRVS